MFRAAMPGRSAKPCRALGIWSVGGSLLGGATALLGPLGIMVCTAAVERTVHHHLNEQLAYLQNRDKELAKIVSDIQSEEVAHLAFAEANHDPHAMGARLLSIIVASATEILIWISTRGDSLNLRNSLKAATSA